MFITPEIQESYKQNNQKIIDALVDANNGNVVASKKILEGVKNQLDIKKAQHIAASEAILNDLFVFNVYISFILEYVRIWGLLKSNKFCNSWDSLQNAMDMLRTLKRFLVSSFELKHLHFFENQLLNLEKLYPYNIFFSIGAVADYFECNICGNDIDFSGCQHIRGELYRGVMAHGIAKNMVSLDHVSMVKHPKDKRCVIKYEDSDEQFKVVQYLADLINEDKLKPFNFGELQFSKRIKANPDYVKLGRNQKCFCNSGMKFKHCCIGNKLVEGDHIEIIANSMTVQQVMIQHVNK